jgi:hypothetical protein
VTADDFTLAGLGEQEVSFRLRQHLDTVHYLPGGLSYLVPREQLAAFHADAHARQVVHSV